MSLHRSCVLFAFLMIASNVCHVNGDEPSVDENALRQLRNAISPVDGANRNGTQLNPQAIDNTKGMAVNPSMIEADEKSPDQPATTSANDDAAADPAAADPTAAEAAARKQQAALGIDSSVEQLPPQTLDVLGLSDVIASVHQSFPKIIEARQQVGVAQGDLTAAWGSFDTKAKFESMNEPLGFYENYRHSVGASRRTWNGGNVAGGYRIGRGSYQPWYLERETDKGGELKVDFRRAFLQGRAIDPARVGVFQATLDQKAVAPMITGVLLMTALDASVQYWNWVESGLVLNAQQMLVDLAVKRNEQFTVGVEAGKFPEVDLILNRQLIAERKAKLIESRQKFQANAFKLSLFLRDGDGNPLVPDDTLLPQAFPPISNTEPPDIAELLAGALSRRPEVQQLEIKSRKLNIDLSLARNQTLPVLDFVSQFSQDIGEEGTSSNDKGDFQIALGVEAEVPVQRRKARGKCLAIQAKLQQLNQKQRFT